METRAATREEVFYRSHLSEGPMLFLFLVLTICAWKLTMSYPNSVRYEELFGIILPIPFFALVPTILFFVILHRLKDNRYEIWDDHVRAIKGLLSLQKDDTRIEYLNIRGIEIKRGLYGRIFNIGDLIIVSAAAPGVEVVIDQIKDPSKYRDIILKKMRDAGLYYNANHGDRDFVQKRVSD